MITRSLFGTSGIRGDAEQLFTKQFCFDIGRTFSKFLENYAKSGNVAVGLDPRGSSPRIKDSIISGLVSEKREIYDEGATSVPSMCYMLQVNQSIIGSVMVTGSHIKSNLNGIKFFLLGEEILKKHEKEIEEIYFSLKDKVAYKELANSSSVVNDSQAKSDYTEMLLGIAKKPFPNWKVVVDAGNGAQSDIMPQVLSILGLNVIEQNCTLQGEFFARDTEHQPDLEVVINKVKAEKADFGIAYDADGDRVVFIDENGKFIPGDYSASIISKYDPDNSVVTTIAASQVVDTIGKKVIRTKVGAPHVIEAMKKNNISFGFEPNGGCFFKNIMLTRDGGSTTIKFLNILKNKKCTVSELISELPNFYLFKDKLDYKWEMKDKIEQAAIKKYNAFKMETLDGVKIWFNDTTWLLFRSSLNAPEFRIFSESEDKQEAEKNLKEGLNLLRNYI